MRFLNNFGLIAITITFLINILGQLSQAYVISGCFGNECTSSITEVQCPVGTEIQNPIACPNGGMKWYCCENFLNNG